MSLVIDMFSTSLLSTFSIIKSSEKFRQIIFVLNVVEIMLICLPLGLSEDSWANFGWKVPNDFQ